MGSNHLKNNFKLEFSLALRPAPQLGMLFEILRANVRKDIVDEIASLSL